MEKCIKIYFDDAQCVQLLCPWTNCVERFAVYRHLAGHVQEQTENISVWRCAFPAFANLSYVGVIIIIVYFVAIAPGLTKFQRLYPGFPG